MALMKAALVVLLFLVHHAEGYEKVIFVSEPPSSYEDKEVQMSCCATGNCTCYSFLQALKDITNDTLISITTTKVDLTEIVEITSQQSIRITGHNTTIICRISGGIAFQSCNKIIIEHLTWDGCGQKSNHPSIGAYNSNNIAIRNCTLQNSVAGALQLKMYQV